MILAKFDPGLYLSALSKAVGGLLGDLRVALRSLEDGSFVAKAEKPRPGALLHFSFELTATPDAAAVRLCNRCFVSVVGELITYLDRMIAVQLCTSKRITVPSGITTPGEVLDLVQRQLEEEYSAVAKDRSRTNPKKLNCFPGIDPIARDSALSYFAVRRCLEHHGGRSGEDMTLWYGRLKLLFGDMEITKAGQTGPPGVGISLGMDHVTRVIPAGTGAAIREDELEHIVFTVNNLIGPEILRVVREACGANMAPAV